MRYKARYIPPKKSELEAGEFEYESIAKAKSKKNALDARMALIELLGNVAPSCVITNIEKI